MQREDDTTRGSGRERARLLGLVLGGALVLLLPVIYLPGYHDAFVASKLAAVLVLGVPAYALLAWSRSGSGDGLGAWRWLFVLYLPLTLGVAAWRSGGFPHLAVPFLFLAVTPFILLEVGGAFGATPRRGRILLSLLALSALPVLAIGLLRRFAGWPDLLPDRPDVGLAATIGNSNALAEYAAPIIAVGLALGLRPDAAGRRGSRAWWIVSALAALALVLLSESRGGLLAAGAAVLTVMVLHRRVPAARRLALVLAFAAVLGGATIALLPQAAGVRERLASIADPEHPTNVVRVEVWKGTTDLWREQPLLGIGAGRYEIEIPRHRSSREWLLSGVDTRIDSPHDEVLWILAEGGLVGALFLLAALALAARGVLGALRSPDPERRTIGVATLGALAAFTIVALVRSPLHHACGVLAVAALLGAASAAPRGGRRWPGRDAIAHVLVAVMAVLAMLDLSEDLRLERALRAHRQAGRCIQAGDSGGAAAAIDRSTEVLREVVRAPVVNPWRLFRATLLARDLAASGPTLARRFGIRFQFPDSEEVRAIAEKVLSVAPHHSGAIVTAADLDRDLDQVAAAVYRLEDAIRAMPQAPRFRRNLAGILAAAGQVSEARDLIRAELELPAEPDPQLESELGKLNLYLGTDAPSTGIYLGAMLAGTPTAAPAAQELLDAGEPRQAWELLLRHLSRYPTDAESLLFVAELGFGPLKDDRIAVGLANRAVARQRLLAAVAAERADDLDIAALNTRIACGKDPTLRDARLLQARIAARQEEDETVLEALLGLRETGVSADELRARIEDDPHLKPLLSGHLLDSALRHH